MKVKSVLFLLLFTLCYTSAFSQEKITWKELTAAYRKEVFKEEGDNKTLSLKDIQGKEITVRGYFLDLGADAMWYMLSRFPFENCFFCTGVGPETVIEIADFQNEKSKFKTDDIVIVTGTLYLEKEEDDYFYVLKNGTVKATDY